MDYIRAWFRRNFADPQATFLALALVALFGFIWFFGNMLAPVLASVVIAYLLEGPVQAMEVRGTPRTRVVVLVFMMFMAFLIALVFGLLPLLWVQTTDLLRELPGYVAHGQSQLAEIPKHYPFISEAQIDEVVQLIRSEFTDFAQRVLSMSIASIPGLITVAVYAILVPLLVFFFLKDKRAIVGWFTGFLPREYGLAARVWREVDEQIGNYVRGKFWEILIVGGVSVATFLFMGMKYAILLGVLVGLSVVVPYIGAAVVTIPVALVAYFQWGWNSSFAWLMGAYFIIQALDGNVLVPLLFSEVVNLHPVAIIVSVLFFGGLWGFWGVFFAIPLATLVNAILSAWPGAEEGDTAVV